MKKHLISLTAIVILSAMLAQPALAWRSVRTGQKNFERAWSAYHFKRQDKATGYFTDAADGFGKALKEYPPSRTAMFPSNLTMAGISFYYAGQYDQCIDAMGKAVYKDANIWEAYIYAALSHARLGNLDDTVKDLKAYIKSSPTQAMLSNDVKQQITDLETASATLPVAADSLEAALYKQFNYNTNLQKNNISNLNDLCSGSFWWRSNKSPCEQSRFPKNNN